MGIEKEREAFENLWLAGGGSLDNFIFSEDQGKYIAIENSDLTDKQKEMSLYIVNNAYLFFVGGFKQAAKAQAVSEGFVLVPKEPTCEMIEAGMGNFDFPLDNGRFSNHDLIFAYKAMIEAQEQSHD